MSSPASLVTRAVDAFYWRRLEGVVSRQLFRYAFCGGMNLALDAVWYFVIYHFLIGEGRMIDLGFVYSSDVMRYGGVKTVCTLPADTHQPIVYPAAVLKDSAHAEAAATFLTWCQESPEAQKIWQKWGFELA